MLPQIIIGYCYVYEPSSLYAVAPCSPYHAPYLLNGCILLNVLLEYIDLLLQNLLRMSHPLFTWYCTKFDGIIATY